MLKKKKIYILLTDTGTLLSRVVRTYTREPLNHASISFDHDLQEVYSFGRRTPDNLFDGGFVRENVYGGLFINERRTTNCAIYSCTVDETTYYRIRKQIRWFEKHQDQFKYNFLGLFAIVLNKKFERKKAYFCSQFVTTVFHDNGVSLVNKPAFFVTPGDLRRSESLHLLFQGCLSDYLFNKKEYAVTLSEERKPFASVLP